MGFFVEVLRLQTEVKFFHLDLSPLNPTSFVSGGGLVPLSSRPGPARSD